MLEPWKTAASIIDWSIPCPSIFSSSKEIRELFGIGAKRPLCDNTMNRIAHGIKKFIIDNPRPFIVALNKNEERCWENVSEGNMDKVDDIVSTPFIVRIGQQGYGGDKLSYSLKSPLTTIVTKQEHCLVMPFLAAYHTETKDGDARGQTLDRPITTIDGSNRYALCLAFLSRQFKNSIGQPLDAPLLTTTGVNKTSLVKAFLVKYYGNDIGQSLDEPLHTITSKDRFALIITIHGVDYEIVDIGYRMLKPEELKLAQGFSKDYVIDHDCYGNYIPVADRTKMIGNSVVPQCAEAIVRENMSTVLPVKEKKSRYNLNYVV